MPTFEQTEQLGVQDGGAEEAQEEKARDAAVADSPQKVAVPVLGAGPDVTEYGTQLDRTLLRADVDGLPHLFGGGEQSRPVPTELVLAGDAVGVDLAIRVFRAD